MRNRNLAMVWVVASLTLTVTDLRAQNKDYTYPATARPAADPSGRYSTPLQPRSAISSVKASTLIGQSVQSSSGERVGTVKDLIVNLSALPTAYAIVAGETAGKRGARVAVPLTALSLSPTSRELILNGSKAQFEAASSTPTADWHTIVGSDWNSDVDRFYGAPTATGISRFERQETLSEHEGREAVRHAAERKGATDLGPQPEAARSGVMRNPNTVTDQGLMTRINDVVRDTQGGQPGAVQVMLEKGVVTLSGIVPNEAQRKQLVSQIKTLPGVARVEDHMITEHQ